MLFYIISFFWLTSVFLFLKREHYLLAIVLGIIGLYEFSESFLIELISFGLIQSKFPSYILSTYDSNEDVLGIMLGRATFLLLIIISYMFTNRVQSKGSVLPTKHQNVFPHRFSFIILAVLIFGLLSIYTGSGTKMLAVYSIGDAYAEGESVAPFFFYGASLLVVLAILGISSAEKKHWGTVTVLTLAALPIVREIAIAGRRQLWVPTILVLLLYLLYSRRLQINLKLWLPIFGAALLIAMGLQFQLRLIEQGGEIGADIYSIILWPLFGEFIGCGHISQVTWDLYFKGEHIVQYGAHWLLIILNSIPYLNLGNLLWPQYREEMITIYSTVSPWGALPMFADGIIGFGLLGIGFVGILIGSLLAIAHKKIGIWLGQDVYVSGRSVYVLSLVSILILKYRSGFGDVLHTAISFSFLFGFFYALGGLLFYGHHSKRKLF